MNEKRTKQIRKMCIAFCQKVGIKYSKKFERLYRKEFLASKRMEVKPLHVRRDEKAKENATLSSRLHRGAVRKSARPGTQPDAKPFETAPAVEGSAD